MAIQVRTRGETILIRLKEVSPGVTGVAGAHYDTVSEFVDDNGAVVGGQQNPPVPVDLEQGLPALLGELTAGNLIQIEQLTQQVGALAQKNESLYEQLQTALAEIDRLTAPQAAETATEPEQA